LRFASVDRTTRIVLFTSAGPEEGKSTTLANLAVTEAQAGSRVLLLDCDLRRPRQHTLFDVPNEGGLASFFLNSEAVEPPMLKTAVEGLCIVPTGPRPPNPADLLASDRFAQMLTRVRDAFQVLFIDAPPVTVAADTSILAPLVDGVVLVVDARRTHRDQARRAKEQIESVHGHLLGIVLNNAKVQMGSYG
jgi:non-specific protein-tyrosine kinase